MIYHFYSYYFVPNILWNSYDGTFFLFKYGKNVLRFQISKSIETVTGKKPGSQFYINVMLSVRKM